MTVLRSREVLPRPPPRKTTSKRAPRKNPTPSPPPSPTTPAIGPRTPARADAAPPAAPPRATPELGFGAPSPAAPRRSPRLASRSPEASPAEFKVMGDEEQRVGRGKRGRDAPGAGGSASRSSPRSEGEKGDDVVGFDLNLPAVEFPSGNGGKKREERGMAVNLTVSYSSSSEESKAVWRRVEVIEVESDAAEEEVELLASRRRRYSSSEKGKGILVEDDAPMVDEARFFDFLDKAGSPAYDYEQDGGEGDDGMHGRRYIEEEKGKGKLLVEGEWLTLSNSGVGSVRKEEFQVRSSHPGTRRRESDRRKAIELAPKFALYKPEEEEDSEGGDGPYSPKDDPGDWPGPFSTAVKIINEREKLLESRQLNPVSAGLQSSELRIEWRPSGGRGLDCIKRLVPSLRDLALRVLVENAAEIESLEGVPDELRHQVSWCICKSRMMEERVLALFVRGSPTEIRVPDCSWATEEQFERIFGNANTDRLTVLQLDLCGRCLPDYTLSSTLAKSPEKLCSLTKISLKGAYRLSDDGLNSLASSAPLLSSIDLGQCSLITSTGITSLVEKLKPVLREVYLDDCHIDAMSILPALKNLKKLEVLSVAGIESITNRFVHGLVSVHGAGMKELVFAGCKQLTATSVKGIGEKCTGLHALDLRDLVRLDDCALVHLANGCTSLRKLMLRHNSFSDKAVAALLEASGGSLAELSLNNIREVSNFTAQAIAIRCSLSLRILDLSFCRKTTDEGLGLIVDSCSYLRILKVFGCRQITSTFLEGHSNSNVKIIGLEGSILQHLEMPGF